MIDNILPFLHQPFKEGKSTLQEMYLPITERLFPFITFITVNKEGKLISSVTMPWARFRDVEDNPKLIEIRNNDSDTEARQTIYIERELMEQWIFVSKTNSVHYVFYYYC